MTAAEFDDALVALTCSPASAIPGWQARLRINRIKLAGGTVRGAAEVVRDLAWVRSGQELGISERAVYERAREILERELGVRLGLDEGQARRRLDQLLASARPAEAIASPRAGSDRG